MVRKMNRDVSKYLYQPAMAMMSTEPSASENLGEGRQGMRLERTFAAPNSAAHDMYFVLDCM